VKIWKSTTISILIGLIILAGWMISRTFFSSKKVNNLELISRDAIFTFESYNAAETWNQLVNSKAYPLLQNFPAFKTVSSQIAALDSLTGSQGIVASELAGRQTTVSLHPVGKENFDLMYMLSLREGKARDMIDLIKGKLKNGERFQSRTYSDREILELFDENNDRKWSVAFLGDLVLVSSSSFMIEEAIRFYENPNLPNFASFFQEDILDQESEGRILITSTGIANLLKGVQGKTTDPTIAKFEQYRQGFALDLNLKPYELGFNGNINFPEDVNFTPSINANINAILDVIPSSTSAVTQINLEGIYETQKLVNRAFTIRETLTAQIELELLSKGFLDTFYGDLYFLTLEKIGPINENFGLIARSSNTEAVIELLKNYQNQDGSVVSDFYRDQEIILINEQDFIAHVFNGKFQGFNQTWVSAIDDVLIFSNNQQSMKLILDDIANGDTWGKSTQPNPMKNSLTASSGFSKTILSDKSWDAWTAAASPYWSSFFQRYRSSFQQFYGISLKLNQYPDRLTASLTFPFSGVEAPPIETTQEAIALEPTNRVVFDNNLIFGPQVITNYQDGSEDIVVQDENYNLILLNSAGDQVYSVQLDGPVISDAFQIDYYKNQKLQLLVATQNRIYGIDRLGNPLSGYPITIPGKTLNTLNLVDYNNTKAYRYFVSTEDGQLYLLDKTGQRLDGWDPKPVGAKTIGLARHVRVPRQGDYMIAFTEPGLLHFFNRRGERQVPNPVNLGTSFKSSVIAFNNPSSKILELVNISIGGEIKKSNFNGEITYTNQLVKEGADSEFFLVADQDESDFLIVGKEFNKIKILDSQENEMFTVSSSTELFEIQFFNFGTSRRIISVTDLIQEFSYLYDADGNLLTTLPLESSGKVEVSFDSSGRQYIIRCRARNQIIEYAFAY